MTGDAEFFEEPWRFAGGVWYKAGVDLVKMAVDEAGVKSGESAILAQEYLAFELDAVEGVLDVFF